MEKYFRQIAGVYKHYKTEEKRLSSEVEKAQKSGNYSSNYLSSLALAKQEELKETYHECNNTLSGIRQELEKALTEKNDLLSRTINPKLQALLDSGIVLDLDEWKSLALKCKSNPVESRLLHDRAAAQGITLNCYISTQQALEITDKLIRDIRNSMYGIDPIVAPIKTVEEAESLAGACWGTCTIPNFNCYYAPKNLNEAIKYEYEEHLKSTEPTEADGEAFLSGIGAVINNNMLAENVYMDRNEVDLRVEIDKLEKSKESNIQALIQKYGDESPYFKERKKEVIATFDKAIERVKERIAENDIRNEQETRDKLKEMEKKTTKTAGETTGKKELTDTDLAFMKGFGIDPESDVAK